MRFLSKRSKGLRPRRFRARLPSRIAHATQPNQEVLKLLSTETGLHSAALRADQNHEMSQHVNSENLKANKTLTRHFYDLFKLVPTRHGCRQLDKIAFEAEHGDFTLEMGLGPKMSLAQVDAGLHGLKDV